MKQRLYYIDNLKGILILLVILGHCIQFTTADFDHHPIFRFIYSFHMPLFMTVSGYVSYKAELKWESLSRRFMQLVVPFLAWAAISMLAKADPGYLLTTLLQPDMGLWFLWVLFAISALLTACHRLASRLNIRTELTAAALTPLMLGCVVVFGLSLFGAHLIAWYFIFYCMGFFFRKYESAGFSMPVMASVASLLIFIALLPFWMRTEPPTFLHGRGGIIANYAYKFVTAFFAMFAIIPLAKRMLDYKLLAVSKLGGGNAWHLCNPSTAHRSDSRHSRLAWSRCR